MAENPLLPHRRLLELHALMLRCRELDREWRQFPALAREAVLAASTIQMEPGDLICADAADSTAQALTPGEAAKRKKSAAKSEAPASVSGLSKLTFAAGMGKALQTAGNNGVVVALVTAGERDVAWTEAMTYAQHMRLPIMFVCIDSGAPRRANADAITETAVGKLCKKLFLPTLSVDGEDAVAMYRAMQESFLRTRTGDGPAVIWSLLPKRVGRGVSVPIANMEKYLAARGLKPRKRS